MTNIATILILGLCLLLSFLLSGMEAGLFTLNRLRLRRFARAGNSRARTLNTFLEHPEKFLWTILVGNTLVNFLFLGWAIALIHGHFQGSPLLIILSIGTVVFVFYTICDLLPKMLFRAYPNRLCLAMANVSRVVQFAMSPLVLIVEELSKIILGWTGGRTFTGRLFGNREEMRAVMAQAAQALTTDERTMVNRILDLQHFTVAQVAIPLEKTSFALGGNPVHEAMALASANNLSRLPVLEIRNGQKRIAGMLDVNALLFSEHLDATKPAAEFMTPALYLEDNTRLEVALRKMQRAGQRMTILLTHDRREAGIVTLEDILKLMFGEVKL